MSDAAPAEWRSTTLGEVTRERSERVGGGPPPVVLSSTKHYGLVRSDDFFKNRTIYSTDLSNYKTAKRGWFVYATNHLAEGSIGLQDQYDGACVSPIYTVFSCELCAEARYLLRFLKSPSTMAMYQVHEQASVNRRGSIRYSAFATIPLALPPLPEQRRIAGVLDAVDEAIRETEALIAKLTQIHRGLIADLLTRGIDKNGALRDPVSCPAMFHMTPVGLLPTAWEVVPLAQVTLYQNGGTFPSTEYGDHGIPLLRPGNLRDSEVVSWDKKHTTFLPQRWEAATPAFLVQGGEVVMNLTAQSLEEGFLGRACITDTGTRCLLNQRIARFMPFGVTSGFLLWFFRGPVFRRQIDRAGTGSKVQHLYNSDLDAVMIPVPPAREAEEIRQLLMSSSAAHRSEVGALDKLRHLRTGLASDLLAGRIRVDVGGNVA